MIWCGWECRECRPALRALHPVYGVQAHGRAVVVVLLMVVCSCWVRSVAVGQEPSERSSWCDRSAAKHRYAALVMSIRVCDINGPLCRNCATKQLNCDGN